MQEEEEEEEQEQQQQQQQEQQQQQQQQEQEQQQEQVKYSGPYTGDGIDPLKPTTELPKQTTAGWVAYTVSLNYNRLATSPIFAPITRWNWYDPIPHTPLILGAVPLPSSLLSTLQKQDNVKHILNMCAEFRGHLEKMRQLGIYQCWVPTLDFHTPTLPDIWTSVRFIAKCQKQQQQEQQQQQQQQHLQDDDDDDERGTIYLHCKDIQRHYEVVSFYDQVLEQEADGSVVRMPWPSKQQA
ncbi:hypothetical protein BG004_000250 [Podila humilis]|nr:hypothetical protein BG004_000250 [Podila humilis]